MFPKLEHFADGQSVPECSRRSRGVREVFPKVFLNLVSEAQGGWRAWRSRFVRGLFRPLMTKMMTSCQVNGNSFVGLDMERWRSHIRMRHGVQDSVVTVSL